MVNYLKVLLNSNIALAAGEQLYLYIIGAPPGSTGYYSYSLSADKHHVATQGAANTVYPLALTSLGVKPANPDVYYFHFDQSQGFSGRIWFSTSNALLTIASNAVTQPIPSLGLLYDFVEVTINANSSVNIDTSQVSGLGIPISIVNPAVLPFPPSGDLEQYTYPNAIGIVPGLALNSICNGFTNYTSAIGLSEFSSCVQSFPAPQNNGTVQWLLDPGSRVLNYQESSPPTGLATSMDAMLYQFFNYYLQAGNELVIYFNNICYTGTVSIAAGFDKKNPKQEYCVLCFTDPNNNQFPIFYPYFNTNSAAAQGGSLNPPGGLPPPPSWWQTKGLPSTTPASGQVFLCNGVFNDSNPGATNATVLAALQNIIVTMLNRGLVPGTTMDNLFVCNGKLTQNPTMVTFTDPNPNNATLLLGASLIYTPTQIPGNTTPATCFISGTIELPGTPPLYQAFSKNNVSPPPSPLPSNYCTSMTGAQPNPNGQVQFPFDYVSPGNFQFSGAVTGSYSVQSQSAPTATFNGTIVPAGGVQVGMNVLDVNVQNPATVCAPIGTDMFTIQSTINGILPSPGQDTLLVGNFYPRLGGAAKGCWNAYAGFLHYGNQGCNGVPAPYISNQGYGFAYDDDGGYSSDITVNFPENSDCNLGIYLGPLIGATVQANQSWHATGVCVSAATPVTVTWLCGLWTANPATGMVDANGNSNYIAKPKYTMPGQAEGALIGRIGTSGVAFLVGDGPTVVPAGQSGELYLCINDDLTAFYGAGLADNTGSVSVQIKVG